MILVKTIDLAGETIYINLDKYDRVEIKKLEVSFLDDRNISLTVQKTKELKYQLDNLCNLPKEVAETKTETPNNLKKYS